MYRYHFSVYVRFGMRTRCSACICMGLWPIKPSFIKWDRFNSIHFLFLCSVLYYPRIILHLLLLMPLAIQSVRTWNLVSITYIRLWAYVKQISIELPFLGWDQDAENIVCPESRTDILQMQYWNFLEAAHEFLSTQHVLFVYSILETRIRYRKRAPYVFMH